MIRFAGRSQGLLSCLLSSSSFSPVVSSPLSLPTRFNSKTGDAFEGIHQTPIVDRLWSLRKQKQLDYSAPRTSTFSKQEILYNFEEDPDLRDKYANPWGFIRIGRVLEDIDALAGNIAHTHCCGENGETDLLLVTASVDQIKVKHRANLKDNMTLSGEIIHSGKSSLEIKMTVTSDWTTKNWLSANFCFVARDPKTGKAANVPALVIQTEEEQKVFDFCEQVRQKAKEARKHKGILDIFGLTLPSETAAQKAASLLQESTPLTLMPASHFPSSVLIQNTKMATNLICHHQHRNIHGRIFGGFLMRQAFEIAFINAYQFLESQPLFVEVDRVVFHKPVEIGNLLKFESCILYTTNPENEGERPKIHVEVSADIITPECHKAERSNLFHFTFETKKKSEVKKVLPGTVEEAVRIANMMELNEKQEKNKKETE
mmetsp:Transcript_29883/g.46257  ORF Transcript_29883/g.46257 Transcript_29883/m.46257 type:complete len:430 (-) Transcript_29883:12-1301(-)